MNFQLVCGNSMRIVSNYGVLGEISPNHQFSVISPYWDETFPSYSHFFKKYNLSPVCCMIRNPTAAEKELVILVKADNSGALLSTLEKEQELLKTLWDLANISHSAFRVHFYFGALRYHLCSLVKTYTEMATDLSSRVLVFPNLRLQDKESFAQKELCPKWISNVPVSEMGAFTPSGDYPEAIFYEMMAYLTSARSLLDSIVRVFELRPSIVLPKAVRKTHSFHKLLNNIQKCKMPDDLKDSIIKSRVWASNLIEYRDCLLHYEVLSPASLPFVIVVHSESRIIALQTWLPDNPESRSVKKYKFDEHIEYLSYAHITYLHILDFITYIAKFILNQK